MIGFGGFHVGPPSRAAWVEFVEAEGDATPVVLVHGSGLHGAYWWGTPDRRPGWAQAIVAAGRSCYVLDWPAHGRGAGRDDDLVGLSLLDVRDRVAELVAEVGRAVVVTHSRSGPVGWSLLDTPATEGIAAMVGISPSPPANLVEEGHGQADGPIAWTGVGREKDVTTSRFPKGDAAARWSSFLAPESTRTLDERNNVAGQGLWVEPVRGDDPPVLVVTGDDDAGHPREWDRATADLFGGDHLWLPDHGLMGHGHLMMVEEGNDAIIGLVLDWLGRRGV
ncbi:alpha/beta fold hydrolase [Mariniluteicoccus flavus]